MFIYSQLITIIVTAYTENYISTDIFRFNLKTK